MVREAGKQRLQGVAETREAVARIIVEDSEIDADPDHRTPAVEVGAVIDRAFEHAQLGEAQCAGLAGGSDRLPRSRGAVRAGAREKMGPGGERGKRGMLVLGLGPAAANASGWARLPELTWIMAIVAGGSATARAGARWGSRR